MSIEPHLDVHPFDFRRAHPIVGVVKNVVCKDDPRNEWGEMTLYDVAAFIQWPPTSVDLEMIPYLGQMAGGANCSEDPLLIGQRVEIGFMEGDENRPCIRAIFPSNEPVFAQTIAEHPHVRHLRNGTLVDIDKTGNAAITLADGASFRVKDNTGAVIFELVKVGANYEVNLGGDTGLKKLMTDSMIGAFNAHTHSGVTTGPGASGPPSTPISSAHATSLVNAK